MKIATGAWILLGIVWLGLFLPLLADRVPAFRDAFHFYYPLEHWLDQQAAVGDLFPQTNPWDGTGTNLVGEMSTGMFYPGRIVWWLPFLNVAQRMGLMLLSHTVLAGFGAAYAARRLCLGPAPQVLAAAAYSLSGPVFFQHVNPIYLISAAWLPWALAECCVLAGPMSIAPQSCSNSAKGPPVRWGVWISACSLMTLGGDPQATLHCGLITAMALLYSAWSSSAWRRCSRRSFLYLLSRFALAVLAVTGLTAIQSLPTWYWIQAGWQEPTVASSSVPDLDSVPALLQSMAPASYDLARGSPYAYSVAPWHGATLLWSNVLGHVMPDNSRFLAAWPAEPRMWTASLSIGLMTMLLAVSGWWLRETRRQTRFLWLVVLLAGTAMLGNYAPMWMLRGAMHWCGMTTNWLPGDEVGGTYWLLTQLVPGYEVFRYPAKWSPVFAASLTLCAAHGLNQWDRTRIVFLSVLRVTTLLSWLLCLGMAGLSAQPDCRRVFSSWLAAAPPDAWLNAIDAPASLTAITFSLAFAAVLGTGMWLICQRRSHAWQSWLAVGLVIVELGWSAHGWLVTVPAAEMVAEMAERLPTGDDQSPVRVWAGIGQAQIVRDQPHSASVVDKLKYQQRFALAKLHLLKAHTRNLSAFMTLTPQALARVRHQLALHDRLTAHNPRLDEALAWLGIDWRLVRAGGLRWQPVAQPAPLLELRAQNDAKNTLHVKYVGASDIRLQAQTSSGAGLVVRLFQDGGWRATLRSAGGESLTVVPQPSHLGLFQSLAIPKGNWDIRLHYQAPGLMLGTCVSGLTLLLTLGAIVLKKTRNAVPFGTGKGTAGPIGPGL